MRKEFKMLLPLIVLGTLVGCNNKTNPSSTLPSSSKPSSISSSISSVITPSSSYSSVDMSVAFEVNDNDEVTEVAGWNINHTKAKDDAICLKKVEDYIETPVFNATGKIQVSFTIYKECGATADGKLELGVKGLDESGNEIESVTVKDADIPSGKDKAQLIKVTLNNTNSKIKKIRIGIDKDAKVTNVYVKDVNIKSVK